MQTAQAVVVRDDGVVQKVLHQAGVGAVSENRALHEGSEQVSQTGKEGRRL